MSVVFRDAGTPGAAAIVGFEEMGHYHSMVGSNADEDIVMRKAL